jgi:hypothetical protein
MTCVSIFSDALDICLCQGQRPLFIDRIAGLRRLWETQSNVVICSKMRGVPGGCGISACLGRNLLLQSPGVSAGPARFTGKPATDFSDSDFFKLVQTFSNCFSRKVGISNCFGLSLSAHSEFFKRFQTVSEKSAQFRLNCSVQTELFRLF